MIPIIFFKQVTLSKWKEEHESLIAKELCGGFKIESLAQAYISGKYSHICMKNGFLWVTLYTWNLSIKNTQNEETDS